MSLIPSESLNFPDSFRATVGWRPLTEKERRRSSSERSDSNGTSNGAESQTTNGHCQAPSQSPRGEYEAEAKKLPESTTEQATLDLKEATRKSSAPVSDTPQETIPAQSPPAASEAQTETESPETISADPTQSKEETRVAPQFSITEIFQKIAEAQGQVIQPQSPGEAEIESPPMAAPDPAESSETSPLPESNVELSEAKGEVPVGVQISIVEILRKIAEAQGQSVEPKTEEAAKTVEFPTPAESDKKESAEQTPSPLPEPNPARVSEAKMELPKIDPAKSSQSDDKISDQSARTEGAESSAMAKTPAKIRIVPRKLKPRQPMPTDQSSVPAEATRLYDDEIVSNGSNENGNRRSGDPVLAETMASKKEVGETIRPDIAPRRIEKTRVVIARPELPLYRNSESRGRWIRFGLAEIVAVVCFFALLNFGITHHFSDPTLTILVDILIFAAAVAMIAVPIAFVRNNPARWQGQR